MANIVNTQLLNDGHRNVVAKWDGILDTSDEAYVIKLDPATLSTVSTQGTTRATRLRLLDLKAELEDGLAVNLWWDVDGTQANAKLLGSFTGRFDIDYTKIGGLVNNAGVPTGKVALSTQGWSGGLTLSYQIVASFAKY